MGLTAGENWNASDIKTRTTICSGCRTARARRYRVWMKMPGGGVKDTLWQDRFPHFRHCLTFGRYTVGTPVEPPPPEAVKKPHPELVRIRQERAEQYAGVDRKEKQKRDGFVYVITTRKHPGMVKIGRSRDPEARVGSANTWCPYDTFEIEAFEFFPDAVEAERKVHERLIRTRQDSKEWFSVSPEAAVRAVQTIKRQEMNL